MFQNMIEEMCPWPWVSEVTDSTLTGVVAGPFWRVPAIASGTEVSAHRQQPLPSAACPAQPAEVTA